MNGIIKIDKPNFENTCIVVVSFNPDASFQKRIKYHIRVCSNVIVVDNGSKDTSMLKEIECIKGVTIIRSNKNNGIAWALNQGIHYAISNNFKYVLTFDQDSIPTANILDLYGNVITTNPNIGCIGTQYSEAATLHYEKIDVEPSKTIITSGCLCPIDVFKSGILYNEKLFIDSVDFDFSLSVKSAGFSILRSKQPLIQHHLGEPKIKYGLRSFNHSAFRKYYVARNHVYITKKYFFKYPLWVLKKNLFFLFSILQILIVDDDKYKKLKSTIRGLKDGCIFK